MSLILRLVKGSRLTMQEMDDNLTYLESLSGTTEYHSTELMPGTSPALLENIDAYPSTTGYTLMGEWIECMEITDTYVGINTTEFNPDDCDRILIIDTSTSNDGYHIPTSITDLGGGEIRIFCPGLTNIAGYTGGFLSYYKEGTIYKIQTSNSTGLSDGTNFTINGSASSDATYTFKSEEEISTNVWETTTYSTITPSVGTLGSMNSVAVMQDLVVNHGLGTTSVFVIVSFANTIKINTEYSLNCSYTTNSVTISQGDLSGVQIGDTIKVTCIKIGN